MSSITESLGLFLLDSLDGGSQWQQMKGDMGRNYNMGMANMRAMKGDLRTKITENPDSTRNIIIGLVLLVSCLSVCLSISAGTGGAAWLFGR